MKKAKPSLFLAFAMFAVLAFTVFFNLPAVQERFGWRVSELAALIKYSLYPPEQVVFLPKGMPPAPVTPLQLPTPTQTPSVEKIQETFEPSPESRSTETNTPTPIPASRQLTGLRHEYQSWNNCGPATLAMALSYWDWEGDQRPIAAYTKPNSRDKNVMPYEMADYVNEETTFNVIFGFGGELSLLKQFIAAGLPVIVEKGFEGPDFDGWMGHYVLVTGYGDIDQSFIFQDSYYGPDQNMKYDEFNRYWRAFNYTYLVIYPEIRTEEVIEILGPFETDDNRNRYAAKKASDEIDLLSDRDQFFAWFNRGSSLVALENYDEAAVAYDQAFKLYPTIPEKERPWRML